ncbi:hypothetical protein GCM10007939_25100 [Amylibacter marinus]|uniref:SlyX protein n=1 Tax=Amylibacter marinus TaxID=1475483 RepID=A0ABQ5VXQ9_9RHOB|nr:SlyX family protein [Amylibacter marinus]GLQ36226.1 hypothetical protein GCM10007939_25100 [Amylibacter marinus]
MENDSPLINLEIKLAEALRVCDELSDIVADQAKRLEVAERRIEMLMARAAETEAAEMSGVAVGNAPPPHW